MVNNKIIYEQVADGYGVITLNREHKRNAISQAMAQQLNELLDELKENPPKFLVLKSAGENVFCSGGDLTELHGELSEEEAFTVLSPIRQMLYKIAMFPVPTIGLLQGNAFGGGCELATACDIRIAKEGTKFGFIQSNLGILPGWGGGALLHKKVHPSFALQWITEGTIFQADELVTKGWLHRVVEASIWNDEATVLEAYIKKSKAQLTFLKQQFLQSIDEKDIGKKMEAESRQSAHLWPSEEHKQAVQRFLNK